MTEKLEKQHRYPWQVIELAVMWYNKYPLPYRAISDMLSDHGVQVSHKTVFEWVQKFGPIVTKKMKKKLADKPTTKFAVDENYVKVNGEWRHLYTALDKDGDLVDAVVRGKKDLTGARAFLKKSVESQLKQFHN